jgi:protein SCO1
VNNKTLFFILFCSISLIVVSLYVIYTIDPARKEKPASFVFDVSGQNIELSQDFKLKFVDGSDFTYSDLQKKFTVIYFGFASCPDFCPTVLSNISQAAKKFSPQDLEKLQFIFVSIDPDRDDLDQLKIFAKQFDLIKAATGEVIELNKLSDSLKVYYAKMEPKEDNDYYVDHSSFVYFINPKADLIAQFSPNASPLELAKYIKKEIDK